MKKLRQLARPTSYLVLLCLLGMGTYVPAGHAAIIGTEAVATASQAEYQRSRLNRLLDRAEVRTYLRAHGVEPDAAKARVDSLTDTEVQTLAGRLDDYPAGEGGFETILILAFLAFLTLLITDILGYTDIFPFAGKSAE